MSRTAPPVPCSTGRPPSAAARLRTRLLLGGALAALLGAPEAARAACDDNTPADGATVTCSGADVTGVEGGDGVTVTVLNGAIVAPTGLQVEGIDLNDGAVVTIDEGGTIDSTGGSGAAISVHAGADITIDGLIEGYHGVGHVTGTLPLVEDGFAGSTIRLGQTGVVHSNAVAGYGFDGRGGGNTYQIDGLIDTTGNGAKGIRPGTGDDVNIGATGVVRTEELVGETDGIGSLTGTNVHVTVDEGGLIETYGHSSPGISLGPASTVDIHGDIRTAQQTSPVPFLSGAAGVAVDGGSTVTLFTTGTITTGTILDGAQAGYGIQVLNVDSADPTTVNVNGTVTTYGDFAIGVYGDTGTTVNLGAGGRITTQGLFAGAIVGGTNTTVDLADGASIETQGDVSNGVTVAENSSVTVHQGAAITVAGSNGIFAQNLTSDGPDATVITVDSSVQATGPFGNGIFAYTNNAPGGAPLDLAITVGETGEVRAAQGIGIGADCGSSCFYPDTNIDLTIAGTVATGSAAGTAVSLNDGDDRVTLMPTYSLTGSVDGGADSDTFRLAGDTGTSATFDLDANPVTNFETYEKQGSGSWTLKGDGSAMAGDFSVEGGTLLLDGADLSGINVTTASGTRLGGNGTVGGLDSGGTVAPGASIGVLHVNGDYSMTTDAVLEVELGPTGASDLLDITGTASLQGTLAFSVVDQDIQVGDVFTVLTADGGVTGSFDDVLSLSGFGAFDVVYNPYDVQLAVTSLFGCIQTGTNVVCTKTDPDGFVNTAENSLDVYVEPDAIVNNPNGDGLTLASGNIIDNPGTIDVAEDGFDIGDGNDLINTGSITAGSAGIRAGSGNRDDLDGDGDGDAGIVNRGSITAATGIAALDDNLIVNDGTIEATGDGIAAGGGNAIANHATIDASGTGVSVVGDGNAVTNDGTIAGGADGVAASGGGNTVTNSGGSIEGGAAGIRAEGYGALVTNEAGGAVAGGEAGIVVAGTEPPGPGPAANTVDNRAGATIEGRNGPAIVISGPVAAEVLNTGTIAGGTALGPDDAPVPAILGEDGPQSVTNSAGGRIVGDISLGGGSDQVSLETGSSLAGHIRLGDDAAGGETDRLSLFGSGTGTFAGDATGAELLEKTGAGSFTLDGSVTVNGAAGTIAIPVDDDADGIPDRTVDKPLIAAGTTVLEGRLDIGGMILVDDDGDPGTPDVSASNGDALLTSPIVEVAPDGTLGGYGTIVTDPAVMGGLFVRGAEADPLHPTGLQGTVSPGSAGGIGTLTVIGRVAFDAAATETGGDGETVAVDNGGRLETDLNDTGANDLLLVQAAGVPTADMPVGADTTGPEGTPDGVFDSVETQAVPTGDGTAALGGTLDVVLDSEFAVDDPATPDVNEALDADGNRIPQADYRSRAHVYDVLIAENGVEGRFDAYSFGGGPNDGAVTVHDDDPATPEDETVRLPLFKGFVQYLDDRVRITSLPDLAPQAQTGNQGAVAAVLDAAVPYGLSEDAFAGAAAEIAVSGDVAGALDQLQPEWFNAFNEVGIDAARTLLHQMSLRSYEARGGHRNPANAASIGLGGSTAGGGDGTRATFWLAGDYATVDVSSSRGYLEYGFDTTSGYAGVDLRVSRMLLVGVAGGFGNTKVDFKGRAGDGDVDAWQVAGYASLSGGAWFLDVAGGAGDMNIISRRDVAFGAVEQTASADYDGGFAYAGARGGVALDVGGATLTPSVAYSYVSVRQAPLTEGGAAPFDLVVGRQKNASSRLEGSLRLSKAIALGNGGTIEPYVHAGAGYEFEDDPRPIGAAFAALPGAGFTVWGEVPRGTTAIFGAGVSGTISRSLSLYLDYRGEIGRDYKEHAVTGGLRLRF